MKKVKEAREELLKERILLLFELGKEIEEDRTKGGSKYNKTLARKIYKSFAVTYPWMSWNKDWKLRHLLYMNTQDIEGMSRI